jgi:hypothetical protein
MIRLLQVLCGPKRHAIYGMMYDDKVITSEEVRAGTEALLEGDIAAGKIRRRCEICDKPVIQFRYEDRLMREQNWDRAVAEVKLGEALQAEARLAVQAARKARNN